MPKPMTEQLIRQMQYGFWVRTRQDPVRAVRWEPQTHEDGRQSFRGKNWVEVRPHGVHRPAERFAVADVVLAGPSDTLPYFPEVSAPVCGWQAVPGSDSYCPRMRENDNPFCNKHTAELESSEGEDNPS